MKQWKSILSAALAGIMILSTAASIGVGAANVTFTDTSSHWAKDQINYLVSKDVLNGYKQNDGTYQFQPNGLVTRAEFIKMLDETFGLTATTTINFSDVKSTDWFYPYFAKAAAQGYLLNYGNSVSPNGQLTREEATTLLVRYLGLLGSEKAPASTFSDYSAISDHYKDAVLTAVQAGLITGYNEGGKTLFKPKGTLTRAEALTILYRAAGAIYKESAYTKDPASPAANAVITKGGVTLSGMTLDGRVIISEGATGGDVTLTDCIINGTLEVRGNVNLSMNSNTKINALTLCDTASVTLMSGCSVGTLTVNNTANRVEFRGNGTIGNAIVNGSNLVTTMIPTEYTIGYGLTANFGGTVYSGSSADDNGFTSVPYMSADDTYNYLNITADNGGLVYYYYTNVDYVPSASEYNSMYAMSNFCGTFNVAANTTYMEKAKEFDAVKGFDYVVVQLVSGQRSYAPVQIDNNPATGSGFLTDPYFNGSEIRFQADLAGTVYYYYSEAVETINIVDFLKGYDRAGSSLRGSISVRADENGTISLSASSLNNYPYVLIVMQNSKGQYYTPVIISAGDNGFTDEPAITTLGTIAYKTNTNGTMYYYYTNDDKLPTPNEIISNYKKESGYGVEKVYKNTAATLKYDLTLADRYDYMVFCIVDSTNDPLTPYLLKVHMETGFSVDPYVSAANEVSFKPQASGSVYWYFSKSDSGVSAKEFMTSYNNTTSAKRGKVSVTRNNYGSFVFDASYAQSYPYIVVMLQDTNGESYQPVVINVRDTTNTGFTLSPYCNLTDKTVTFMTKSSGRVYYYYSMATSAYSESIDDFWASYNRNVGSSTATFGNLDSISFDSISTSTYPGMMLLFVDSENNEYYPVYVSLRTDGSAGQTANGFTVMSVSDSKTYTDYVDVVLYIQVDGTLYYTMYNSKYDTIAKSAAVTKGQTVTVQVSDSYKYLALQLGSYEELVVDLTTNYDRDDTINDGSTVAGTGFTSARWEIVDGYPVFVGIAAVDGEVTFTLSASTYTEAVTKGQIVDYTIPYNIEDFYNSPIGNIIGSLTISAQLTDADGNVYQAVTY